jgi:uncharacterized protein (DUF1330 family)
MLVDKKVKVKWHNKIRKHYESRGYVFTKNGDEFEVNINDLTLGSHAVVEFKCDYCFGLNQIEQNEKHRSYKALMKARKTVNKDCCSHIDCKTKKFKETRNLGIEYNIENSLGYKFPNLISEWSIKNDKDPFQYSYGSDNVVWWICEKGHEWETTISSRTSKSKTGCPYCSGKLLCHENCLESVYPEIASEWHHIKNGDLLPMNVSKSAKIVVWWRCTKGHEWQATVNDRTSKLSNCPFCVNRRACIDNCLQTLYPEISKEWDYNKNSLTPYNVTPRSGKKVWWICSKCNHGWKTTVQIRTLGRGCPQCNESKGEKKVREYLTENKINFITQFEFNDLRGIGGNCLRFDFAVLLKNKLILLIEYDGEFHFKKFYDDDGYEIITEHDKRKNQYCQQNNISLLRIPYWEFDNIQYIIKKELNKYNLI